MKHLNLSLETKYHTDIQTQKIPLFFIFTLFKTEINKTLKGLVHPKMKILS